MLGWLRAEAVSCFTPETLQRLRIPGNVLREELERDETPQFGIFGLVHHIP